MRETHLHFTAEVSHISLKAADAYCSSSLDSPCFSNRTFSSRLDVVGTGTASLHLTHQYWKPDLPFLSFLMTVFTGPKHFGQRFRFRLVLPRLANDACSPKLLAMLLTNPSTVARIITIPRMISPIFMPRFSDAAPTAMQIMAAMMVIAFS